eukprot:TRINITY_DN545_c1_g1_i3.p1 TRINITY_DN545_c1_g1~~TRINITY_DN545_c1_g1_i3.p1  ORF type:complete len:676 (-),score=206.05 TRINITY_DN545_c1_g1_i3:1026-3053(-)
MVALVLAFVLAISTVQAQSDGCACHDVQPETEFPCQYYVFLEQCSDDIMRNDQGQFAYCFCSCGRCVPGADVPPEPVTKDLISTIQGGNVAIIGGSAVSTSEVVNEIANAVSTATADITAQLEASDGADPEQKAVDAAKASAEAVATAIATAFAATEIRATTRGDQSEASGIASARAESIANATAKAYATAFATAGDNFVEFEASTLENDVKNAIVNSYSELQITGDSQASVVNEALGTAVAEVIATATSAAFASYANGQAQAIGQAIAQAEKSECPQACNNDPPGEADGRVLYTCEQQVEWGKCTESYMSGYCECACNTCAFGAQATTSTQATLQTEDDKNVNIATIGDAFAEGIGGADAAATAIVEAVASGNAETVVSAVSEAFASGVSASAVAEAVAKAIGDGGAAVTQAVSQAFSIADNGGNAFALAESIVYAYTAGDANVASAFGEALSSAVASGGCDAIASALTQAEAIAEDGGVGDAFAEAASASEAVNDCLSGSGNSGATTEAASQAQSTAVVEAPIDITAEIVKQLEAGDITKAVDALVIAIKDQSSESAAKKGIRQAHNAKVSCDTIITALLETSKKLGGSAAEIFAAVTDMNVVKKCLTSTISGRECVGQTNSNCCNGGFPQDCNCSRLSSLGCRQSLNSQSSVPGLGFYVYTDNTFRRDCYCK